MKSCLALGRLGFGLPEIQNVPLALACLICSCELSRSPCREFLLRKEVIQPHVPVRLPCYDFTLLTGHSLDGFFLAVRPPALRAPDSDGVTGGVYKARERIHRGLADPRLLAIPTSGIGFWGFACPLELAALCTNHCSMCVALGIGAMMT